MDFTLDLLLHSTSISKRTDSFVFSFVHYMSGVQFYIGEELFLAFAANYLDPTFLRPYHSLNLFAITEQKNRFTIVIFRV